METKWHCGKILKALKYRPSVSINIWLKIEIHNNKYTK